MNLSKNLILQQPETMLRGRFFLYFFDLSLLVVFTNRVSIANRQPPPQRPPNNAKRISVGESYTTSIRRALEDFIISQFITTAE